jgi:hypothetical protein
MAGWILLALLSTNSIAVQPASFKHVRAIEPRIRRAIADGYARSPTFKTLVDAVDRLPCVVYIGHIVKLSDGMSGALLHSSAGSRERPVLRVLLKASLAHDEAIAVIGHELQHVVEVVGGAAGVLDFRDAVGRSGYGNTPGLHRYDTPSAIAVTESVTMELKENSGARGERPRQPRGRRG